MEIRAAGEKAGPGQPPSSQACHQLHLPLTSYLSCRRLRLRASRRSALGACSACPAGAVRSLSSALPHTRRFPENLQSDAVSSSLLIATAEVSSAFRREGPPAIPPDHHVHIFQPTELSLQHRYTSAREQEERRLSPGAQSKRGEKGAGSREGREGDSAACTGMRLL